MFAALFRLKFGLGMFPLSRCNLGSIIEESGSLCDAIGCHDSLQVAPSRFQIDLWNDHLVGLRSAKIAIQIVIDSVICSIRFVLLGLRRSGVALAFHAATFDLRGEEVPRLLGQ